ncbi:MAG: PfkB family carbohydrate kinase [Candidatus Aenigmatarchaeota archaeon]
MKIDVSCLGDLNLDVIFKNVFELDKSKDEQYFCENVKIKVGGGVANFSIELAKLGMKVRVIGCIGNDFLSDFIEEELRKFKIDLKVRRINSSTGITIAFQPSKENKLLLTYRGNNKFFSIEHIEMGDIKGEILYISGYNLLENLRKDISKIIKYAKEKNMIVCLDPDLKAGISFEKNEFFLLVKNVDVLFINEYELKKISNSLEWFKGRTLVVKKGSKGAFAIEKGEKCEIDGIKLEKPMNTTGAGDVFNAAFLHHYYYGYDLIECLEFANEEAVKYIKEINSNEEE